MNKIQRSIDELKTELGEIREIKATIAQLEELQTELDEKATTSELGSLQSELRGELDEKVTIAKFEKMRAKRSRELDEKATIAQFEAMLAEVDTKGSRVQVDVLTEMMDLMRLSLDRVMVRFDLVEARQLASDLKMEDFRSEVRVFGEGIRSNLVRIENVEDRVDHLESKSA